MDNQQRRHYSRICFHGRAHLLYEAQELPCEVLDLSLKGALVALAENADEVGVGQRCLLELELDGGEAVVRMEGEIAHHEADRIGLVCREIDLDSITHLRRLLELNLGDAELLNREFCAMISG